MRRLPIALLLALFAIACDGGGSSNPEVDSLDENNEEVNEILDDAEIEELDTETDSTPEPILVAVEYSGTSHEVELGALSTTEIDGQSVVSLETLLAETWPGVSRDLILLDFEAIDGFNPADSPNCVGYVPVAGNLAEQGGLDPATGDLMWAASLAMPGCLKVKETRRILVSDAPQGLSVSVVYQGTPYDVALAGLATTTLDGIEVVLLDTVIEAAGAGIVGDDVTLDFESSDGFRPGNSGNCTALVPVDGAQAGQGGIDPSNRDLVWAPELGFPGCMGVGDLAILYVADK